MDVMDLKSFGDAYPTWFERRKPDLDASDWKTAFTDYPFAVNPDAPWSPLKKSVSECSVMVLSTAGLYLKGQQERFRAEDIEGDWSFRELPSDAGADVLEVAHTHYSHDSVDQDLNAVYPMDRLRELQAEGVIGTLAERHLSISGYCTRLDLLVEETLPDLLSTLRADPPDVVLHIPV